MKSAPQQHRAILKRSALIKAAFVEFSEHGFEATTARSIAARAGVATGTFYQHFHNKDEALVEIARQRFATLHDNIDAPLTGTAFGNRAGSARGRALIREVFRDALNFVYDFHQEDPGLHDVLEQRRRKDARLDEVMGAGESVLVEKTRVFVARFVRTDVEATAFCLFAMAEGLVHRHVFQGCPAVSREKLIAQGVQLLAAFFEQKLAEASAHPRNRKKVTESL